jgi:hypothetical protein
VVIGPLVRRGPRAAPQAEDRSQRFGLAEFPT